MSVTDLNDVRKAISKEADGKAYHLVPHSLVLLGIVSVVFSAIPELDLVVSRLFWDSATGFALADNIFLVGLRDTNRFLPWIVVGTLTALLVRGPLLKPLKTLPAPHKLLFVLTFFAVGPGLSVHLIKILVGRARPGALEEFGGHAFFTPPWDLTDQCARNCSFISGEAASAFALLTLVVLVPARYSTLYLKVIGAIAAAVSLNRVAFGAHFLSDVVIAWTVMFALAVLLWRSFSRNAPRIDAVFAFGSHRT